MQQKLLAFGDDFAVTDENGNQKYYFDGKVGALRKTLAVLDKNKNQIAQIKKKMMTMFPTYIILKDGEVWAEVVKQPFTFRQTFKINKSNGESLKVTGKLIEYEYLFSQDGQEVAKSSKKWVRASDSYAIDITGKVNDLLVLCSSAIIDLVCHPKRDSTL